MVTGGALMVYVLCASRTASSLQIYPPPVRSLRDGQLLEDAPEERLRIAVEARLQRRGLAAILVVDAGDACDVRRRRQKHAGGRPGDDVDARQARPARAQHLRVDVAGVEAHDRDAAARQAPGHLEGEQGHGELGLTVDREAVVAAGELQF